MLMGNAENTKVIITGGTGSVGTAVVNHFLKKGFTIRVLGRRKGINIPGAEYVHCDITNFSALLDSVRGFDAIVHIAGVQSPFDAPGETVYRINAAGTFNVYEAASKAGIGRVVSASSINALGYFYATSEWEVDYLPIDETHPSCVSDPYSLSKVALEETARHFFRRDGITGCCLRLPWVYSSTPQVNKHLRNQIIWAEEMFNEWFSLPKAGKEEFSQYFQEAISKIQRGRILENPVNQWYSLCDKNMMRLYVLRNNFFTNIDARDSAGAFEAACILPYEGMHVLFVNDTENCVGIESKKLMDFFYPGVKVKHYPEGCGSIVDISRAQNILNFKPNFSISRFYS
jgi:NAD(P)-dependent dehydrogenase (short-subunit alcohol dehydrogenase family)